MKLFQCPVCGNRLYFENTVCAGCATIVGYSLETDRFEAVGQGGLQYCNNAVQNACNWLIAEDGPAHFCLSCRLNEVIPPIGDPLQHRRWTDVEAAKRRLVYGLWRLGLPVVPRSEAPDGLAFRILVDSAHGGAGSVLMGHENGIITIDASEADPPERESRRVELQEPFRTLLGHMRHESGHYYWERLIQPTDWLAEFRTVFGDEQADYEAALARHYGEGPAADWQARFISAYATMHPWEDWAETWAHYLHMVDAVETARANGFWPAGPDLQAPSPPPRGTSDFETLYSRWVAVLLVMNSMNRSLGHNDFYPFVVSEAAKEKLRFVHRVVTGAVPAQAMAGA